MNSIVPIILCTQNNIQLLTPYLELCKHFPDKSYVVAQQSRQFEILALIERQQPMQNIELIFLPESRGTAPAAAVATLLLNKQCPEAHAFILDSAEGDTNLDGLLTCIYSLMNSPPVNQLFKINSESLTGVDCSQQYGHYFAPNNTFVGLLKILQLSCYLCASRCCDLAECNTELSRCRYYLPPHVYKQGLRLNLEDAMRHGGSCLKSISYSRASSNVLENAA